MELFLFENFSIYYLFVIIFIIFLRFVPSSSSHEIEGSCKICWSKEMWEWISNSTIIGSVIGILLAHFTNNSLFIFLLPVIVAIAIVPFIRMPRFTGKPFIVFDNGIERVSYTKTIYVLGIWLIDILFLFWFLMFVLMN